MELQRVLAKDTRSAMKEIQNLYGDDALVVSNNKTRGRTEIIVAVDLASISSEASLDLHHPTQQDVKTIVAANRPSFSEVMEEKIFKSPTTVSPSPFITAVNTLPPDGIPKQTEQDQQLDYIRSRELLELVKSELASIREEVRISQRLIRNDALSKVSDQSAKIIERLNVTGMPLPMRVLVSDIIAEHDDQNSLIETLNKTVAGSIKESDMLDNLSGIHIIAGPLGSGKTRMATRIARQKAFDYGHENVAVISFNDNRAGAWDQTQLLGMQAGVNTFSAMTPDMLLCFIEQLSSRTLILIDTAGTDIEVQLPMLKTILPEAQTHLLLPANASQALTDQYININNRSWSSVMISRLEEGIYPWPVVNRLMTINIPLSVASTNNSVIEPARSISGHSLAAHGFQQLAKEF
jgi:flagellar biosynthesis protein FlhF